MRPGDVDDITHWKRGLMILGFEKKQWVEFLPPNERVKIKSWARPDDFVRYGRRALVELRADDVKAVSIKRLYLSLSSCRITFNSKVIKSFVPELRSRKGLYLGFLMSISHIRISGYVTAVEYTNCISAEGKTPEQYPWIWYSSASDDEDPVMLKL